MRTFEIETPKDTSKAAEFLGNAYHLMKSFVSIHGVLMAAPEDILTEEYVEDDIDISFARLFEIQNIIADITISNVEMGKSGVYCTGAAATKLSTGTIKLMYWYDIFNARVESYEAISDEDASEIARQISFALGDYIYALRDILHCNKILSAIVNSEEYRLGMEFKLFYENIRDNERNILLELNTLQRKYVSVVPVAEENPEQWETFIKSVDPKVTDPIITFGAYVFSMDLRAFNLGLLAIDGDYIDRLQARADSEIHPCQTNPNAWNNFQKKIPDQYLGWALDNEFYIPSEMIVLAENRKTIDAEFIEEVMYLISPDAANKTNIFPI